MNHPRPQSGTLDHALGVAAETIRYLKARATLTALEAKAAGVQYGVAAAMVAGALLIAVLGYIFLIVTAVFAIGLAFEHEHAWVAVLGVAALIHLGGAVALILTAKNRVADTPFPETFAEIEKDRLWLRHLTTKN